MTLRTPEIRCHVCGVCNAPAVCRGSSEGGHESYACNDCCGHGNEDGRCIMLSAEHAAARRAASDDVRRDVRTDVVNGADR